MMSVAPLSRADRISARRQPKVSRAVGGASGDPRRPDRRGDCGNVGEHVEGVGEEGQRVGDQCDDGFADSEDREGRSGAPQR